MTLKKFYFVVAALLFVASSVSANWIEGKDPAKVGKGPGHYIGHMQCPQYPGRGALSGQFPAVLDADINVDSGFNCRNSSISRSKLASTDPGIGMAENLWLPAGNIVWVYKASDGLPDLSRLGSQVDCWNDTRFRNQADRTKMHWLEEATQPNPTPVPTPYSDLTTRDDSKSDLTLLTQQVDVEKDSVALGCIANGLGSAWIELNKEGDSEWQQYARKEVSSELRFHETLDRPESGRYTVQCAGVNKAGERRVGGKRTFAISPVNEGPVIGAEKSHVVRDVVWGVLTVVAADILVKQIGHIHLHLGHHTKTTIPNTPTVTKTPLSSPYHQPVYGAPPACPPPPATVPATSHTTPSTPVTTTPTTGGGLPTPGHP
jgi:hypothetical protein